jgi:hypothetical protein
MKALVDDAYKKRK